MSAVFRVGPLLDRTVQLDTVLPTSLPVPTLTDGSSISHNLMMLLHAVNCKGEESRAIKQLGGAHVEKKPVKF